MRISDWRSDVCSSDLVGPNFREIPPIRRADDIDPGPKRRLGIGVNAPEIPEDRHAEEPHHSTFVASIPRALKIRAAYRSEERRVGIEWVSPCRSRWATSH